MASSTVRIQLLAGDALLGVELEEGADEVAAHVAPPSRSRSARRSQENVGVTHVEAADMLGGSIHRGQLSVERGYDGRVSTERAIALLSLTVSLLLLWQVGPPSWHAWRIFIGTRTRRMADAGPLEIPPPAPVALRIAEIMALGFTRIGERFLQLPATPIRYEWVLGEASGETYVSLVPSTIGGCLVSFYSSFEDSTWVQTNFPRGAVVQRPTFFATFVATSLQDAINLHRAEVARLVAEHGSPRQIRTMADTLRMDADYRTHHGGVTLRPLTAKLVAPGVCAAVLAALWVAGAVRALVVISPGRC